MFPGVFSRGFRVYRGQEEDAGFDGRLESEPEALRKANIQKPPEPTKAF